MSQKKIKLRILANVKTKENHFVNTYASMSNNLMSEYQCSDSRKLILRFKYFWLKTEQNFGVLPRQRWQRCRMWKRQKIVSWCMAWVYRSYCEWNELHRTVSTPTSNTDSCSAAWLVNTRSQLRQGNKADPVRWQKRTQQRKKKKTYQQKPNDR